MVIFSFTNNTYYFLDGELFPYACLTSCYWRLAAALSTSARQEGGPQHSCCGHLGTSPPWSREVFLGFVSNMTMMTWIRSLSCTFVKDYFIAQDPFMVDPVTFCERPVCVWVTSEGWRPLEHLSFDVPFFLKIIPHLTPTSNTVSFSESS